MPLYEYVCRSCKRRFERYVRSWNEAVTCPACEGGAVDRQPSSFALAGTRGALPAATGGGCGCGRGGCGCHS